MGKTEDTRQLSADLQRHVHNIARLERLVSAAEWIIAETKYTLHDIKNNTDQMVNKNMTSKRMND